MKYKVKTLFYILLLITFLLSSGNQLFGQEKVNMSAGIGFPELLNVGIRYQFEQTQIGIGLGYRPVAKTFLGETDNKMISILSDFYYHFGGYSEMSKRRPWYLRSGLIYCDAAGENNLLWLNCRVGRDLNVSKKFGLSIVLELFWNYITKKKVMILNSILICQLFCCQVLE